MKIERKDYFTIPNLLGYFRLALIPVFVYCYWTADTKEELLRAGGILVLSGVTDMLDGKIARALNQVTELGKFLDPLADKLTQGAVLICFVLRNRNGTLLLLIYVIKEMFMGVVGLAMLHHNGRKLDGAMWFGKVCTATLYVVFAAFILFPAMGEMAKKILLIMLAALMLWTLCCYVRVFDKMWKLPRKEGR